MILDAKDICPIKKNIKKSFSTCLLHAYQKLCLHFLQLLFVVVQFPACEFLLLQRGLDVLQPNELPPEKKTINILLNIFGL